MPHGLDGARRVAARPLPPGFRWPDGVCPAWGEELDAIVEVGGLVDLTMHPFIRGRPARAAGPRPAIERARSMDGVWVAACDEIAAWVAKLDLPPVTHRPSVAERQSAYRLVSSVLPWP